MEIIQHKCLSLVFHNFVTPIIESVRSSAHLHESYRTLRDGCFGWRRPRHFVPGYDRTVPPGHFAMARGRKSLNVTFCKCPNSRTLVI
jgi:hypothetical protein